MSGKLSVGVADSLLSYGLDRSEHRSKLRSSVGSKAGDRGLHSAEVEHQTDVVHSVLDLDGDHIVAVLVTNILTLEGSLVVRGGYYLRGDIRGTLDDGRGALLVLRGLGHAYVSAVPRAYGSLIGLLSLIVLRKRKDTVVELRISEMREAQMLACTEQ